MYSRASATLGLIAENTFENNISYTRSTFEVVAPKILVSSEYFGVWVHKGDIELPENK